MNSRSKETFSQILMTVAPQNVQSLEYKARTASSLAETYRESGGAFRAIESEAIQQILRILVYEPWIREASVAVSPRPGREPAEARVAAD